MSTEQITAASRHLRALAARNAKPYLALPGVRAAILMGSAAEGVSDYYSDLDMALYYDTLPAVDELRAAAEANGALDWRPLGEPGAETCAEVYVVQGVECQVAHATVAAWERDMATVLDDLDVASPLQKALSGMGEAIPLHGEALVRHWQERIAAYPEALAQAMVEHYLRFFPLWSVPERVMARDAALWLHQILVETEQNALGVLAGLNRVYYTPFQFKRLHRFIAQLRIAPDNLASRLDALLLANPATVVDEVEALVQEIMSFVEAHMPQIDTAVVRRRLAHRERPWASAESDG